MRVLCAAALLLLAGAGHASARVTFPLFKQCDPKWGNDTMGVEGQGERNTVCHEGCAMSSLAMGLAGLGVKFPGDNVDPGSLNRYLVKHHLYTCAAGDCNNLVLPAPEAFTNAVSFVAEQRPPPALPTLQAMVQQQTHLALAHVRNASHFVLLTGVSGPAAKGVFAVNDPGFAQATYAYAEMADVILYRIVPAAERAAVRVPHAFPLFKQCNSSWGSDVMEKQTICDVGCLMSSCSMALRGNGVALGDGKHNTIAANPGTLNTWLRNNHGYTSGDDLDESALPRINATAVRWPSDGMHTANDLPYMTIRAYQLQGRTVIANVMQGHHFVLVTGWNYTDPDMVLVNDPGFDRASYSYSKDVVGWRLFDIMDRASWPASL